MASKIWPAFMLEPRYLAELEAEERDTAAQEHEDRDIYLENVRLGFEEAR